MLEIPKPEVAPSQSNHSHIRNKLAIVMMMGASMLGCKDKSENVIEVTPPQTTSAKPEQPKPEIPRCERKVTCIDESKYAFTPRENIQEMMDKYKGAKSLVDNFSGNGCRNVAVFVPDGFDPDKKIELIFHFHGAHGNLIGVPMPYDTGTVEKGKMTKGKKRFAHVLRVISAKVKHTKRNSILVYPISAGRRGPEDTTGYQFGYDEVWMQENNDTCDSMQKLDTEVRERIQKEWGIDTSHANVTITGHSAGGKAILRITRSGYRPNHIRFLDSSYDYWAEETYENITKNGRSIPIYLYVKPNTSTQKGAEKIEGKKNVTIFPSQDPDKKHGTFVDYI